MCRRKPKLLVILGSGASAPYRMSTVAEISTILREVTKGKAYLVNCNCLLKCDDQCSIYDMIEKGKKKKIQYEEFLYYLMLLSSYNNSIQSQNHFHNNSVNLSSIFSLRYDKARIKYFGEEMYLDQIHWNNLIETLIDKTLNEFRKKCRNFEIDNYPEISNFYDCLEKEYSTSIISLNYDDIIDKVLRTKNNGFDKSGEFKPHSMYNDKWEFYYNLHGSVHFNMRDDARNLHTIFWEHNLDASFAQNSLGRSSQTTSEGIQLPNSCIITGYEKTLQLLKEPYLDYYADFIRKINYAEIILFIGYGFNDNHVNRIINKSLIKNRKRPVIVIKRCKKREDPMQFRADEYSHHLQTTIPANYKEMSELGNFTAPIPEDLAKSKKFEISNETDYPFAIWYSGTEEAYKNPDVVINEIFRQLKSI